MIKSISFLICLILILGCEKKNEDTDTGENTDTGCEYNGKIYKSNTYVEVETCGNCDDYCVCFEDGSISYCTACDCGDLCQYNSKNYTLNDEFDAIDGCNTCTCKYSKDGTDTELRSRADERGNKLIIFCTSNEC